MIKSFIYITSMLKTSILLLLTISICCPALSYAQSKDSLVNIVRKKYQQIRNDLKTYDTVSVDLEEESTEGGEATGYYAKKDLKLISLEYFGETGKKTIEYYFDKGQLFFAYERNYTYNRPIYWDKERMKENNDTEVHDPAKKKIEEDRYYFSGTKLIRWLDKDKKQADLTKGTNKLVGQGLIVHASKIRDLLGANKK